MSLARDLRQYMEFHPVRESIPRPSPYAVRGFPFFMKTAALLLIVVLIFGGGGVAFASQKALPGEPLYSIKAFTEDVQETLTFDPDRKARLHTRLAEKRISEMEKLLEEKGVEAPGLEVAQARLEQHAKRAARVVKMEAERGREVSELAALIVDDFYLKREEAKKIFEAAKEEIKAQRKGLHGQLVTAIEAENKEQARKIRSEIARLGSLKDEAEIRKNAAMQALKADRYTLYDQLEKERRLEVEARNRALEIREAKQKVFEVLEETQEKVTEEEEATLEEIKDVLYEDETTTEGVQPQSESRSTAEEQSSGEEKQSADVSIEELDAISKEILDDAILEEDLGELLNEFDDFDSADLGI